MNTTLNLEPSRAIYEAIGEYETEKHWTYTGIWKPRKARTEFNKGKVPAPTFGEVIRILTKLGEKKGWKTGITTNEHGNLIDSESWNHIAKIVDKYIFAPTEEQGMREVGNYLLKLLKV